MRFFAVLDILVRRNFDFVKPPSPARQALRRQQVGIAASSALIRSGKSEGQKLRTLAGGPPLSLDRP